MTRWAFVVGAGGHARVVLSVLAARGEHDMVRVLDVGQPRPNEHIMGAPVTAVTMLDNHGRDSSVDLFLALGDNQRRREWWDRLRARNFHFPPLLSPSAIVDPTARLGAGVVVCARAFIGPEARVGDNVLVNTGAIVEHEVRVGQHCHLAPGSVIAGRSRIGEGTFLGAGAVVIDGVTVGAAVTIGAGATVIRDIPDHAGVFVGTPAAPIRPAAGGAR